MNNIEICLTTAYKISKQTPRAVEKLRPCRAPEVYIIIYTKSLVCKKEKRQQKVYVPTVFHCQGSGVLASLDSALKRADLFKHLDSTLNGVNF